MTEPTRKLSDKGFTKLVGLLKGACQFFYLSKIGHSKIGEGSDKNYDRYKKIWDWILVGLRITYLSSFASLFDPPFTDTRKEGRKYNISIRRVIEQARFDKVFSKNDRDTIGSLKDVRNKICDHFDEEDILAGKRTEQDYNLDFEKKKITALIKRVFEVFNQEKHKYNYHKELNLESIKKHVEEKFDDWYKIFLRNN